MKNELKNTFKCFLVIILYFLFQNNFLIELASSLGFNILLVKMPTRIIFLIINDLIFIISILLIFKNEIINGIKDLKNNTEDKMRISLICWFIGCTLMAFSSFVISLLLKEDVSQNEQLVRDSIQKAPFYMLFSCSIVAPLFEELVFRKSINEFIKNKWLFILVSGISFGLLHVIGSSKSVLEYLYVIPYGAMGSALAYLLFKTKNIALPIMVHMFHNTILVIMQLLRG